MKDINEKESANTDQSYRMCFEAERLLLTGKTKEAIEKLKNAADTNKSNELALDMLGSIYNELKSDEAKNYFEASIKLNPKFYLSYRALEIIISEKKEYLLLKNLIHLQFQLILVDLVLSIRIEELLD